MISVFSHLKRDIRQATFAVTTLSLLEFSRLMNREDDPDRVYNAYLLSLLGKLRMTRGAVAVRGASEGEFVIRYARGRAARLIGRSVRVALPESTEQILRIDADGEHDLVDDDSRRELTAVGLCYSLPVHFDTTTFAVTFLGDPFVGVGLPEWGESYAMAISAITAMAIEGVNARASLSNSNRRLERRVHRLTSLFESSRVFAARHREEAGGSLPEAERKHEIVHALRYTLMGEMTIARVALYLREAEGGRFRPATNLFPVEFSQEDLERLVAETGTLGAGQSDSWGKGIFIDESWSELWGADVRAAIPLHSQGETEGVLLVGRRLQYDIDAEDLEYLGALGVLAITAIENVRLLEEMVEKERMKEELRIAWEIQQQLLPPIPHIPGFEVAADTVPAREVGGDCYDLVALPDGRYLVTIADVSGKGVPASLLMANVQAALRALAPLDLGMPELAARVNDLIHDNTAADRFITAFLLLLDPQSGAVEYVNAGHNPPFLLAGADRERRVRGLVEGGLILGVMPTTVPYESGRLVLEPGESIVMYTDGVTEAMNDRRQEYGEDRLVDLLCRLPADCDADRLVRTVIGEVKRFVDGARRSDDITVICLRRAERSGEDGR